MVYPFVTKTLTEKITLAAAGDYGREHQIEIPREHAIQQIAITLTGTGVNTTGSTVFHEDNPMNLIQRIVLEANDTTPLRSVSMVSAYFKNLYDYGVGNRREPILTAGTPISFKAVVLMDFKRNVRDKLDMSMLLPAHKFSSLYLKFTIGQLTDLADTIVALGTVEITATVTYVKKNPIKAAWDILYESEHPIAIAAAHPTFEARDLEGMGSRIRRITLFARDNSIRDDALMTLIKIRDNQKEYEPLNMQWVAMKDLDLSDYKLNVIEYWDGAASVPVYDELAAASGVRGTITGMAAIDFDKNLNMSAWYPAQNYTKGNLQLQYQNGGPTGVASLIYVLEYLRKETL